MIDRTRHRAPRAVRALGSVIAAILCLAGCASSSGQKKDDSAADRPTWLAEGEHPEYPSHGYVTGLGKAENRQAAYASALSEIAFQIKADIDSSFEMNTSERAVTKGNETTVSRTSDRDEVIELKSQLDTMGLARLVDTYVDDSGVYHVFAALDRSKAHAAFSKRYREKRKKYAKVADNLATSIESANMRVLANHVERLGRASDDLKSTRRIVSALGGGISSGETKVEKVLNAARDRLATLRSRTSCEICVKGKDGEPETLTETLRNKLADWIANRDVEVVACRAGRGAGGSDAQGGERAPGDGSNASASDGSSADVAATERNRSRDGSGRASESHSRRLRLNVELNMRCKRPKGAEKLHMCRAFAQFDLENLQQGTTVLSKSIGGEEIRETRRNLRHAQSLTLDNLVELARDFLTEVFGRPA